jgi:hypothetical protein
MCVYIYIHVHIKCGLSYLYYTLSISRSVYTSFFSQIETSSSCTGSRHIYHFHASKCTLLFLDLFAARMRKRLGFNRTLSYVLFMCFVCFCMFHVCSYGLWAHGCRAGGRAGGSGGCLRGLSPCNVIVTQRPLLCHKPQSLLIKPSPKCKQKHVFDMWQFGSVRWVPNAPTGCG